VDWAVAVPGTSLRQRPHSVVTAEPAIVVLDTNIVLEWLVFEDARCAGLRSALAAGRLRWVTTPAMRVELAHVLARGGLEAWRPDPRRIWAQWDRHAVEGPRADSFDPSPSPRCTDPDDQMFIDLAIGAGARWLLSRDRAVLKLRRRLREFGVEVVAPDADWPRHGSD
jgi:predicted nucleic acid-binding protein